MQTTWLYAKQHKITGLRYFGKTTNVNPYAYQGSGLYWKAHCKKHGWEHVETTWAHPYTNEEILSKEALFFSHVYKIVESDEWANLKDENGFFGAIKGTKHSAETKAKMSAAWTEARKAAFAETIRISPLKGTKWSAETRAKMLTRKGTPWSAETRAKMSIVQKGRIVTQETRAKIAAALTGKSLSAERIAAIKAGMKKK